MNCRTARRAISDYIDGELDSSTAADVEAHLARCRSCPPLAAALQAVLAQLRDLPETSSHRDALERALLSVNHHNQADQGET